VVRVADGEFRGALAAAQAGDEDAFASIWREYHPQLLRYLEVTDWYRSGQRRYESVGVGTLLQLPSVEDVEGDALERSTTDRAVALIAQLPPDQAEAVMLRVVSGLDVARVAAIMDRSPGSVRVLCHRGLKRLESMLRDGRVDPVPGLDASPAIGVSGNLEVEVTSA
jgi:RNA polymerase sigma-70 factor (ECF subfamily)